MSAPKKTKVKKERKVVKKANEMARDIAHSDYVLVPETDSHHSYSKSSTVPPGAQIDYHRILMYYKAMANPRRYGPQIAPKLYNPVPTEHLGAYSTTTTFSDFVVAAGTSASVMLYPGMRNFSTISGSGGDSIVHLKAQPQKYLTYGTGGASHGHLGPSTSAAARPGLAGFTNVNLTAGKAHHGTLANANVSGISWTRPVPLTAESNGRFRWVCTAIEVEVINISPELIRGGNIATVQPTANLPPSSTAFEFQSQWMIFPSYKDHGPNYARAVCNIRRDQQVLSCVDPNADADVNIGTPGLMVFFNAPAAEPQSYKVNFLYHWNCGGESIITLTKQVVNRPANDNIVQPAQQIVDALGNNHEIHKVAEKLLAGSAPTEVHASFWDRHGARVMDAASAAMQHAGPAMIQLGARALGLAQAPRSRPILPIGRLELEKAPSPVTTLDDHGTGEDIRAFLQKQRFERMKEEADAGLGIKPNPSAYLRWIDERIAVLRASDSKNPGPNTCEAITRLEEERERVVKANQLVSLQGEPSDPETLEKLMEKTGEKMEELVLKANSRPELAARLDQEYKMLAKLHDIMEDKLRVLTKGEKESSTTKSSE